MSVSLQNWEKNNWLVKHKPEAEEIGRLLEIARRDLKDSQIKDISTDWQLNIAYNAALQAATAALSASGYRASRDMHHFRVIGSLAFTIGAKPGLIKDLDKFRKKRNTSDYEVAGTISEGECEEMIRLAKELTRDITGWIKKNHPELLK